MDLHPYDTGHINPLALRHELERTTQQSDRWNIGLSDTQKLRDNISFFSQKGLDKTCMPVSFRNAGLYLGAPLSDEIVQKLEAQATSRNGMSFLSVMSILDTNSASIHIDVPLHDRLKQMYTFSTDEPTAENEINHLHIARFLIDQLDSNRIIVPVVDNEKFYSGHTRRPLGAAEGHGITIIGYSIKDSAMNVQLIDPGYGIGMLEVGYERLYDSLLGVPAIVRKRE